MVRWSQRRNAADLFFAAYSSASLRARLAAAIVDLDDAVLQFVFRHRDAVGTEGVRFEHVHADLEERAMDFFHGFGIRDDEVVVASVVLLAAEMLGSQVLDLQAGSHRAVEDEDFLFEGVEVAAVCVFSNWSLSSPNYFVLVS